MINSEPLPPPVHLLPQETVLWVGRPHQGLFAFSKLDAFLVPFSFLWASFAIFWNVSVWQGGAPFFFRMFGLPFLLVGLYVTIGRLLHNKLIRSQMTYVLTTRRALIVRNGSVREQPLVQGLPLETTERGDGTGTIQFGRKSHFGDLMFNPAAQFKVWLGPAANGFVFYRIADFRAVADASRQMVYGNR